MRLFKFAIFVTLWATVASTAGPTLSPTAPTTMSPTSSPTIARYTFGQSAPLTNSLYRRMGLNLQAGITAAFRKVNDAGGVNGRMLDLITYDDGGLTNNAVNNTLQFIEDKVLGLMTYIKGTTAAQAFLSNNSMPFIGPYAGWRSLRYPVNRYIINTRASMDEEVNAWVSYCIARGVTLFAVYYQDDNYGKNGLDSVKFALANRGLGLLTSASFPADSSNVSITGLRAVGIDPQSIVVIGGTPEPLGQFVALAKKQWPNCLFHASAYGSDYFLQSLIDNNVTVAQSKDIFVTQVFPVVQSLSTLMAANATPQTPGHSSLLLDFALAMNTTCPTCNLTQDALEGFVAGMFVAEVLDRMEDFSFTNPKFRPYLLAAGVNASVLSLDHGPSVSAWREFFIDTLYVYSTFDVSGLRLGPFVPNITCAVNNIDCIQPTGSPCSQGMQNVFLTQPDLVKRKYVELPQWRVASPVCNFFSTPVPEEQKPLVFGQSAVFSGNAPDLGTDMRNGILAAFAEANKSPAKGVRGRELLLLSMDDYYQPAQAAVNARALLNQSLIAVIGSVGTPPTEAVIPVYSAAGVPLIGPQSGARSMRNPWVINLRALYDDEVANMVDFAIKRGLTKVSLLAQNDTFGQSGIDALQLALEFHRLSLYSVSRFDRLATNFTPAFLNLTAAGVPEILVIFGTQKPCAAFIEITLNSSAWANTLFLAASPSDPDRYRTQLSRTAIRTGRVYATTVMPTLGNDMLSQQYLAALQLLDPRLFRGPPATPTLLSFEGYLLGRFVIAALARVTQFNGKQMLDEIHVTYGLNIGNYTLGPYTSDCNMGLRDTYLVRMDEIGNTTGYSFIQSFRAQPHNSFIPNCGALTLYNTSFMCPEGYIKEYVDSVSLASRCSLCLSPYGCHVPERVADMSLRAAMLALNIVGFGIAVVFLAIVWKYQETVTIKAVSPPFCLLILLGAMCGYVYIFIQYNPMPTDEVCMAQVYVLNTASCLIFASLFAKVFRVTQIFKPRSTEAFRVLKIRDGPLFIGVGGMWIVLMLYTIAWHATEPMVVVHNSSPDEQYYVCESPNSLWGIVDILANGIFLLYGVMLSIQSRKIPTVFNEAKFVAATMYNTLIIGTIAILAGYELAKNNDQLYMYKALGAFVVFTVDLGLLIASKFPSLYAELFRGKIPQFKNDSSSDANSGGTSGTNETTSKTRESSTTRPRVEMEKRSATLSGTSGGSPVVSPRSNTQPSTEMPAGAVTIPIE